MAARVALSVQLEKETRLLKGHQREQTNQTHAQSEHTHTKKKIASQDGSEPES